MSRATLTRVVFSLVVLALPAVAHQPGLSSLAVLVRPDSVAVELTLSRVDAERLYPLDSDRDGNVSTEELEQARLALEELSLGMVELTRDGKPITPDSPTVRIEENTTDGANKGVQFSFQFPVEGGGKLRLRSAILHKLPPDHRHYFTAYDQNRTLLGAWLLERKHDAVDLPSISEGAAEAAHNPQGFGDFLKLGVEHIVTGYDHLVFLLGLLIVGGRFAAAVKIITAFTVAHSITLALATLDLIRIPSAAVEPLIAASIIYVGVENIFRRDLERRWMLAFGFGLIHGCGFATVLRDLGVGSGGSGVIIPLLSFNLVETGQVLIAAIVLPIIWKLKERPTWQPRYVPACSVLIALLGGYWLVTRLIGIATA
jgi:hydrogenase/urease accessory protein HupE